MNEKKNVVKKIFAFRETTVILFILIFCILLGALSPYFFTWSNIKSMLLGLTCDVFLTVGMTLVLVSGGIDLSVGSVMAATSAACGIGFAKGMPMIAAILLAVAIGLAFGVLNGLIIGKTTIAPMIATLATMQIGRGLALVLTGGSTVSIRNVPGWFTFIGTGMIGPIPFMIVLFIVTVVVMDFLMRKNQSFRKIYYIGSNENSARLSGISVFKHRMLVYIACSLFATVAGIITTSRFSVSSPTSGEGAEMTAIAAAVIGGASTNGGEGTVFGSLLGLILLNLITNALVLLNVSVYWQKLITGIILLLAVFIDFITHSLKNKK